MTLVLIVSVSNDTKTHLDMSFYDFVMNVALWEFRSHYVIEVTCKNQRQGDVKRTEQPLRVTVSKT